MRHFGLSGHIFVNELDRTMGIADEAERSKKLKQFQEWNVNVHGAIQVCNNLCTYSYAYRKTLTD